MSFDERRGDLWVGDVGWEMFEMVDRIEKGGNYGWSVQGRLAARPRRASAGSDPDHCRRPSSTRTSKPARSPAAASTTERSIRSRRRLHLRRLRHRQDLGPASRRAKRREAQELCTTPLQIVAFGADKDGELLIVDHGGSLHELEPTPPAAANRKFPTRLSETGLFASTASHEPAPGVVPYSINAAPPGRRSDGGEIPRPAGETKLGVYDSENVQVGYLKGAWKFPVDGVLAKTVSLPLDPARPEQKRRVETQIMHFDGRDLAAYSYVWNDHQDDAEWLPRRARRERSTWVKPAAPGGKRQKTWRVAARSECLLCHTTRADRSRRSTRRSSIAITHTRRDGRPVADPVSPRPVRAAAGRRRDDGRPVWRARNPRAAGRAYLHLNCGHCHRRGGAGPPPSKCRSTCRWRKTNLLSGRPTQGTFGIHGAQLVAPGQPARSVLYYRMAKLGNGRMPHFGSHEVDERGLRLIGDWIESLGDAPATCAGSRRARGRQSER